MTTPSALSGVGTRNKLGEPLAQCWCVMGSQEVGAAIPLHGSGRREVTDNVQPCSQVQLLQVGLAELMLFTVITMLHDQAKNGRQVMSITTITTIVTELNQIFTASFFYMLAL